MKKTACEIRDFHGDSKDTGRRVGEGTSYAALFRCQDCGVEGVSTAMDMRLNSYRLGEGQWSRKSDKLQVTVIVDRGAVGTKLRIREKGQVREVTLAELRRDYQR
jgi:hypothetical protein